MVRAVICLNFSQLAPKWAIAGAALWALQGCGQDSATVAAASADAKQGDVATDVAAADTAMGGKIPTIAGEAHSQSPYVELTGEWQADAKLLNVVVWLGDFTDLLGIAGHLRYDATKLQLVNSEALPLTEESAASGFQYRAVLKEAAPGQLLTGTARFRTQSHPFLYPEGAKVSRAQWLMLQFEVKAVGKSTIAFDPKTLLARKSKGELETPQWLSAEVDVQVMP